VSGRPGAGRRFHAVVIGAGPAGLMAAERLRAGGAQVDVHDAMPSVGRKFLLAGIGGLNLTHGEPREAFLDRYAERRADVARWLDGFDADAVRAWARGLGIETFVGTSGRVFPTDMKAAPLLRAWLHRLRAEGADGEPGVRLHMRHRWTGWTEEGALRFVRTGPAGSASASADAADEPSPATEVRPDATILALGGASWPRLGSDGAWAPWLASRGVDLAPLRPANCGFDVAPTAPGRDGWSEHLRERCAGDPLKAIAMTFADADGTPHRQAGECVVTRTGLEGSLMYAFAARVRDAIARDGRATVHLDLLPQRSLEQVRAEVSHPRGPRSLSTHLKSRLGLHGAKVALLHEMFTHEQLADAATLAGAIKSLPVTLAAPRPVDEAISTAGGVRFEALDERQMLRARPGTFCAGEMIDWEAPTGGYLLTACLASGRAAGEGALAWWREGAATHE
jgi:uncharacterized flavoprotein (TIGR03862 family)